MKLSDRMVDFAVALAVYPIEAARKLPKGWLRFIGFLFGIPLAMATTALSIPLLPAIMLAQMWEEANQ